MKKRRSYKYLICTILVLAALLSSCRGGSGIDGTGETGVNGAVGTVGTSVDCVGHIDADANDICDRCSVSVLVTVDFYAINDLHGKFDDTDSQPGVDELTTYLKNAKKTDDHAVFLSAGDMWQGSAESNMTKGKIITDWMNALEFEAMTLGNHEFDWGEEPVEDNAKLAKFPMLAINIFDKETNKRVDYASASVMVERGGVKIGIIGAIGNCYSSISPDKVKDVYFKVGGELTSLVKAESERLRAAGADMIVYSVHAGSSSSENEMSSYYDIALSAGYVDLVFEGHTHQRYVAHDRHGVYHFQNGGENKGISHAEVAINFVNDKVTMKNAEFVSTARYMGLEDDPTVDELLKKYENDISGATKVLGINKNYMSSNALCDLAAKLYYEAGVEKWGAQYNIALGGGFFQARSPYNLPAGEVTYGDLQAIFPFDNQLVLCSIQGKYLSSKFFNTSNSNYHIAYGEYGKSIKNSIDPNATYYVIVDSYTSTYAPNRLTEIARYDETTFARDLLAEYFEG